MSRQLTVAALLAAALSPAMHAQLRRPKAEVTPIAGADVVRPGDSTRVAVDVTLPPGLHVQSDKPRDPSLIPTTLTVTPPPGVTVIGITYPAATDLKLSGGSQTLAVFGEHFTIGVQLAVAPTAAAGDVAVPARLHYQACDASACFPPANETASWTLHVAAKTP